MNENTGTRTIDVAMTHLLTEVYFIKKMYRHDGRLFNNNRHKLVA